MCANSSWSGMARSDSAGNGYHSAPECPMQRRRLSSLPRNRQAGGRPLSGYRRDAVRVSGICRTGDLEALVRQANAMAGCRSFQDVVAAFRAMRELEDITRISDFSSTDIC